MGVCKVSQESPVITMYIKTAIGLILLSIDAVVYASNTINGLVTDGLD